MPEIITMTSKIRKLLPESIRWRLPVSYVLIALLTTLSLGTVLLTTLRGYYAQREYDHLLGNAQAISQTLTEMYAFQLSDEQMLSQLQNLAFLAQSRIQVLDNDGQIRLDSGDSSQPRQISLSFDDRVFQPDVLFSFANSSASPTAGEIFESQNVEKQWTSTIDVLPERLLPPPYMLPPMDNRQFFIGVAGTPFGFGLNSEAAPGRYSDQQVRQPIEDDRQNLMGYVQLLDGPAYGTEIVDGVARALFGAGLVAIGLAVAVGLLMSRQISKPLLALTDMTGHMAEGNLAVRVKMERRDEFGLLARSFNRMAGRVENTVTTLRRFVADAAHELHTPITALHANLELAATENDHQQRLQFVLKAQEQLKRLEAMTSSLLDLSRLEGGDMPQERIPLDVTALVREVSELYASRAEQSGLVFAFDMPDAQVIVSANETQLRRVLGNLLDNAIKFTPENGKVCVGLCRSGSSVKLWVQDNGIGIPAEDLPLLFNRFRRGRNAAAYPGSGLGLAITKAIVERHGGHISAESLPEGTRFLLQLPFSV